MVHEAKSHYDLELEALDLFHAMSRKLRATAFPCWMEIDFTIAQFKTFLVLAEERQVVIGHIAQQLGIGPSTAGHLVDKLVHAGVAERVEDPEDRRRTYARLGPKGEELYERLMVNRNKIQAALKELSEEDLAALVQGFRALKRVLDEKR